MEWSPQQETALREAARWLKAKDSPVFRLFGYAGVGKTTLARHLAADAGHVLYAAFTGKAATVMAASGCVGAQTIHSLIYRPKEKSQKRLTELKSALAGEKVEEKRRKLAALIMEESKRISSPGWDLWEASPLRNADLLIVDEVSMVDEKIGKDILSFGVPVLVLGDPFQLPPVMGGGFFTNQPPDVMLTEVHRQALDSDIVRLATAVRGGVDPSSFAPQGEEVDLHRRADHDPLRNLEADQVLVGRNTTRRLANRNMRRRLGHEGIAPNEGERLIVLKNNRSVGVMNGTLGKTLEVVDLGETVFLRMAIDDGTIVEYEAPAAHFREYESPGAVAEYEVVRDRDLIDTDFAYAITVHKFQGSQARDVVLFAEGFGRGGRDHQRWLYTGVTRARERLTVVL